MLKKILLLALVSLIMGCSSTHVVTKPIEPYMGSSQVKYSIKSIDVKTENVIPEHFLNALKSYLNAELKERNILVGDQSAPDREIIITVTYYRMRSGFSRSMWGVFAGKDGIKSRILVMDAKTENTIGSSDVDTYNASAVGSEEDIAKMHAKEIADFLEGK